MLKIRIIPCLDVDRGRVVKGTNFINLKDAGDPVELAKFYNDSGADELCFLDITATKEQRDTLYNIVSKVAAECFIPLTVGGGVKKIEDIRNLLLSGADKVAINSAAIYNPELVSTAAKKIGSQSIVVALDVKWQQENKRYELFTHGGSKETGIEAIEFAKKAEALGAGELLVTSMDHDGTEEGFNCDLYKILNEEVSIPIIASGGVGKIEDFLEVKEKANINAMLAASVFHFNKFTIKETKEFLQKNSIPVRLLKND
ncbi:MAG: imidazole glycerol phosphate synthase subunit HisF [Rickettsiales bacterium]|nr:imidazole glycerol phosphate synthase subunit HisF [Rickettsiales bacterium]